MKCCGCFKALYTAFVLRKLEKRLLSKAVVTAEPVAYAEPEASEEDPRNLSLDDLDIEAVKEMLGEDGVQELAAVVGINLSNLGIGEPSFPAVPEPELVFTDGSVAYNDDAFTPIGIVKCKGKETQVHSIRMDTTFKQTIKQRLLRQRRCHLMSSSNVAVGSVVFGSKFQAPEKPLVAGVNQAGKVVMPYDEGVTNAIRFLATVR